MKPKKSTLLDLIECQKAEIKKIESKIKCGVKEYKGDSCSMGLFHANAHLEYLEKQLSCYNTPTEWECEVKMDGRIEIIIIATEDSDLPDSEVYYYVKDYNELLTLKSEDTGGDFEILSIGERQLFNL